LGLVISPLRAYGLNKKISGVILESCTPLTFKSALTLSII
jgi:hypothetical protein